MRFEAKIILFLQGGAQAGWSVFFEIVSLLGSWVGLILAFAFLIRYSKRYSLTFLISYIVGVGANYVLKTIISRPRPYETYSTIQALSSAVGSSMPSGHAVSSAIIAVFLGYLIVKFAKQKFTKIASTISLVIYVGLVALSRMYFGLHYLSDVIIGTVLGVLIAIIGIAILENRTRKFLEKRNNGD